MHAYLIVAESISRRVTLYANDYNGTAGIIFDTTHGVDDTAPYCLLQGCNLSEYFSIS